jgi:phosphotriesterase-related protein
VVRRQLDLLEAAGLSPTRFVWIHVQNEPDLDLHLEIARRGAWLEYDGIGGSLPDEGYIERIQRALAAGFGAQVLLSMDRGWYSPGQPGGGTPKPFTYLPEVFLPRLRAAGVGEAEIRRLTGENPFRAFAR